MRGARPGRLRRAWRRWRVDTWVRPYLARYRRALAASLALAAAAALFAVGLMFTSGFLIGDAAEQPELGLFSLLIPLGAVQVFGIGKPFLSYLERLRSHDWAFRVASDLRRRLFCTVANEGAFWNATRKAGELLGLLADDIDHIQDLYVRSVLPMACAWVVWAAAVAFLGLFSAPFALMMLCGLLVICLLLPLVSALANAARAERAKRGTADLYTRLADDVIGIADWTFAGRRADYAARVEEGAAIREDDRAAMERAVRRADLAAELVFGALTIALLCWAALHFQAMAQAPAGTGAAARPDDWIAAFVIGFFPLLEAFAPASAAASDMHAHRSSLERLNALDRDAVADAGAPAGADEEASPRPRAPFDLRVSGLSFAYPGGEQVLHGIDLMVPAGQHVALLGPSGCGKSTLLALLRGYLAPTAGRVALGGADPFALGDGTWRFASIVGQDPHLFHASIYENLALGDAAVSREAARQALEAVGLCGLLERLPAGLDTLVAEAGLNFSGGEGRRIALARVLLRDAPVVLLDEPAASLDPISERALLRTIAQALAGRTVVMATHHLAGAEAMDRAIFMDAGRITLDGPPRELERTSERYRRLLAFERGES